MEIKLTKNISIEETLLCSIDKGIIPHIVGEPLHMEACLFMFAYHKFKKLVQYEVT